MASSGALSPSGAAYSTLEEGKHHLEESLSITFAKSVQGGALMGFGCLFGMSIAGGIDSSFKESYPGIVAAVQGLCFPAGLVAVYFLGAELYTGYPMWYTLTALQKLGKPYQYIIGPSVCWLGDLIGAIMVSGLLCVASGSLTDQPYRSAIMEEIRSTIVEETFGSIMLKAVGCGWLVTLAMYIGSQNQDGISKALGLHFPFFIACAAKLPHTVEYMYIGTLVLFLNVSATSSASTEQEPAFTVWMFLWKCMLPVTVGNTIGGSLGMGLWLWVCYIKESRDKDFSEGFGGAGGGGESYRDDDDDE